MKEQKKLTMELVKSLMDESYTLVWTDYNDNLDNRLDLIHECLASKSQEKLWEKADEWYRDSEWEAVHEIVTRLKAECTACFHVDEKTVEVFFEEHEDEIRDEIWSQRFGCPFGTDKEYG